MAPADEAELVHMTYTAAEHDSGPIALRYPRGNGTGVALPEIPQLLEIGKGRIVREGKTVAILSLGTRLAEALKAAYQLEAKGLSTTVADLRFAKPLDLDLLLRLARERAAALGVGDGDRVLSTREWTLPNGVVDALLAPIAVGAHVVQVTNPDPARTQAHRDAERVTVDLS